MEKYYGTKEIIATPMTRLEYNKYRGWELPADENGADAGYLVEYTNGGNPNVKGHKGYVSWSPKNVFEESYQSNGNMSFGHAILALKSGRRVKRAGWNGKKMFLFMTKGRKVSNDQQLSFAFFNTPEVVLKDHIDMCNAKGEYVSGWLASQGDMLAEDWAVLDDLS